MTKLIAWLTKGTKIVRILTYIYRGLAVGSASLEAAILKLKEIQPDLGEKWFDLLLSILEYMKIALEAVEKVLVWLGVDAKAEREAALAEEAKGEAPSPEALQGTRRDSLAAITQILKDELR